MGLDVYLYKYENKEETDRLEAEYEKKSTEIWNEAGDFESLTDDQRLKIRKKTIELANSLGLDEWGDDKTH